ncbi:phage terminase small subunit P27 family [Rhizobium sp. SG570]|uniref:phage terminase small subunit P27 family n=1 Tax=Rhizobium sp. SG570 TaxID=2587113 RepID=UPI0014475A1F|nr:phage terminase small subunit P27 family [Rhizobium sp. SG570]NKJ34121.1 P27 family predicted phage terminase small subunit [Rhizobium sp. SG570]
MARGRKPDTVEQQAAKGAPGKRMSAPEVQKAREPKAATPVAIGKVRPPKWLKRSRKATEIWNDLAPKLERLNLLNDLDATPLSRYCRYIVEWIAADITVQKEGTWFEAKDTNGNLTKKRHPAWQACQDIEKMLRDLEATFGMRPDARYKIMRDQAAAHGLGNLPLWGDQQPVAGEKPTAPAPEASQQDVMGILKSFDSAAPGRPN